MSKVILDTGPLIALMDTQQHYHKSCHTILESISGQLYSTSAVLTETFHFLDAGSRSWRYAAEFIREFVKIDEHPMSAEYLDGCFELMFKYQDNPMDFADATLVVLAHKLNTQNIFTLDIKDFSSYRINKGFTSQPFSIMGLEYL